MPDQSSRKSQNVFEVEKDEATYTLITGDATSAMDKLKSDRFDVIVTSPPYNIGKDYGPYWNDSMPQTDYEVFALRWIRQTTRILKDDGSLFVVVGGTPSRPQIPFNYIDRAVMCGYWLQNLVIWVKSISVKGKNYGHIQPINSNIYLSHAYEFVLHLTKSGRVPINRLGIGVKYSDESNIKRFGGQDRRCRGDVWFVPYKTRNKKASHPSEFPPRLAEMCIRLHGLKRAERILDPFMGVGNTMTAALKLKKNFVGIDINPEYVDIAREML